MSAWGDLLSFSVPGGQKKLLSCSLVGEISTQTDTMKHMCSCCNATYYGDLERHFFVRTFEHFGMTTLTGKRIKNPKKSAIIGHILLKGYHVSFEDFTILLKESKRFKLLRKESLLIKPDKPGFNINVYYYP